MLVVVEGVNPAAQVVAGQGALARGASRGARCRRRLQRRLARVVPRVRVILQQPGKQNTSTHQPEPLPAARELHQSKRQDDKTLQSE